MENRDRRNPTPPTETRRCDSCGRVALCVRFPTARGANTGAFGGLRIDPNW
jgi:hypothetical protein